MLILEFVIVQTVIFVIIFFVLRNMLIKNTTSAVNRLKLTDAENTRRLAEMKKKIEDLEREYELKQGSLPEELEKRREQAKKKTEEERDKILADTREEGKRILEAATRKKNKAEQEIEKELQTRATTLAGTLVQGIFSKSLKSGVNEKLVDELLQEVESMEMGHVPASTREVEIILSKPLRADQMKKLKNVLQSKLTHPVEIRETIRKGMSGGLILNVGSLVVDGSLENLIQGAVRKMRA